MQSGGAATLECLTGGSFPSQCDCSCLVSTVVSSENGWFWHSLDYDIALLVLESASSRSLLPLASSDTCFESQGGCDVRLLGWGQTTYGGPLADSIQFVSTPSVSRADCENLHGASKITNRMICAGQLIGGGYDSCLGDSGGPMILDGQQVGIISFGFGCGDPRFPGVYTSVPKLRSWIDSKIATIQSLPSSPGNPCACAADGISNGVPTDRYGCKQHLKEYEDYDFFCMTVGGLGCSSAQPSQQFSEAAWIFCSLPKSAVVDPCDCAEDGVSNGVATFRYGCKKHLEEFGDQGQFCMTVGGTRCIRAKRSERFPGAGWRFC